MPVRWALRCVWWALGIERRSWGFVGTTGHWDDDRSDDHFEWHPGKGPAVDSFPFLGDGYPPSP
jgi:hypothetical protein